MPTPDVHWTSGREGVACSISKLCNNKKRILGPEWSMSKVGASQHHNLNKPHRIVVSKTHTQFYRITSQVSITRAISTNNYPILPQVCLK